MIQVYILIFSVFVAKNLNGEEIQRITLPKDVVSNKIRLIPKGH